jgi:hypothetical protein
LIVSFCFLMKTSSCSRGISPPPAAAAMVWWYTGLQN